MTESRVTIDISQDEAIVLFEWLRRLNAMEGSVFEDQAEQRVSWDLEALMEARLEAIFSPTYRERLQLARDRVRDPEE